MLFEFPKDQEGFSPLVCGALKYLWHPEAFLSRNGAKYALERLWNLVANKTDWIGAPLVNFTAISLQQVEKVFENPENNLPWVELSQFLPSGVKLDLDTSSLPAVFASENKLHYFGNGNFPLDLVAATFLFLTRWEEWKYPTRTALSILDEASLFAVRQKFHERPLLDEWGLVIRKWLEITSPNWQIKQGAFNLRITHDIDHVKYFKKSIDIIKGFARGYFIEKSLFRAAENLFTGFNSFSNFKLDPYFKSFQQLLNLNKKFGAAGTFYFMGAERSIVDDGYRLDLPPASEMWKQALDQGHRVGWHISQKAALQKKTCIQEWERVCKIFSNLPEYSRHHYLAWQGPVSWRFLEEIGVKEDSSLGFNEFVGFRSSTSKPYPAFDLEKDRCLSITELPLVIQDGVIFKSHRELGPEIAAKKVGIIENRIKKVGGTLTILIHNSFETYLIKPFYECFKCVGEKN
ncbi:MAG: hypothetical protein HQM08_21805 [Candidatus Riflebacteria bacterium]|nr:hypothetical protein [Candidatus Riflebacteria bacterium]